MSDIFEIEDIEPITITKEVKPRKKPELSEEKRVAMLERLKLGREKRAAKIAETKGIKETNKDIKIEKKEEKEEKVIETKIKKELPNDSHQTEAERLNFISMMAGRAKKSEVIKFERPKKKVEKVILPSKDSDVIPSTKVQEPLIMKPSVMEPVKLQVVKQPIIIRNFTKALWA